MIELTLSLHHMPAKRLILVSSDNWRKSSKNEPGALPFALVCRTNARRGTPQVLFEIPDFFIKFEVYLARSLMVPTDQNANNRGCKHRRDGTCLQRIVWDPFTGRCSTYPKIWRN